MPFDPEALLEGALGLGDGDPADDPFELAAGPYVTGQLRVLEFEGAEYVNDLYAYTVTCTSQLPMEVLNAAADGEPACLTIKATGDHEPRLIQGIVESIEALGPPPGDRGTKRKRYRMTIVPKLWLLTQRRTIRYFQYKTPRQIIEKILEDIKIAPSECHWNIEDEEYPSLRFVYQREETDYDFFRRVLSDAGIFFCFEHASGTLDSLLPGAGAVAGALGTVADVVGGPMGAAVEEAGAASKMLSALVFTDDPQKLPAVQDFALANELVGDALKGLATKIGGDTLGGMIDAEPAGEVAFDDEAGAATDNERILEFGLKKRLRPKQLRLLDRDVGASRNWVGLAKKDLATPSFDLGAGLSIGRDGPSLAAHAGFDLDIDSPTIAPSMLLQQLYQLDPNLRAYGDKKRRAEIELDRLRVQRIEGSGQSNCRRLAAGYRFRLTDHPVGTLNTEYTVTAVLSRGVADPASADEHVYRNTFLCIPVRIRPIPPRLPRPKLSDELARVVAVRGNRVTARLDANAYGYVHIRFDWEVIDDEGENHRDLAFPHEHENAVWVPVTQPWAGDGYGMQVLPREGMRVWVGFIEGQGERPFVKGCFYDRENELPFAGDMDQQKVGLFSRTIPENGNWSEISINDRKDFELLQVRAARNLDVHVLRDSHTHVEGSAAEHVEGNSNVHVDKNLGTSVAGVERRMVGRDRIDAVGGALKTTVGGSAELDVTGNVTETVRGSQEHTVVGDSQIEVAGERRTVIGVQEIVNIGQQHVVSVGEPDEPGRSYMTVVNGIYRRRAKTMVLEADESLILRSGKSELRLTPDTISLLSHAIQAASKDLKLRGDGPTLRLDEGARIFGKEIEFHGSESRIRVADKVHIGASSALNDSPGVHALPARIESRYAIELFERAADIIEENEFAAWTMGIYGSDVPVGAYQTLHRALRTRVFQNPKIVLSTAGSLGGKFGAYSNKTREIHVSKDLADAAETSTRDAAELFLVLLHEFGHHVDNVLRRDYTHPPNDDDAPVEEGAAFAYAIAGMNHAEKDHVIFGMYTHDGQTTTLKLKYPEFHQAVKEYKPDSTREEGGKAKEVEGFGEGYGSEDGGEPGEQSPIPNFFAHGSIENIALREADPVFFTNGEPMRGDDGQALKIVVKDKYGNAVKEKDGTEKKVTVTNDFVRNRIYFGNWLRDNSQLCEPMLLTALDDFVYFSLGVQNPDVPLEIDAQRRQAAKGSGRRTIIEFLGKSAKKKFPKIKDEVQVTKDNLGVYRPEEHIDNPKGLASDQKDIDSDLRGPVADIEYDIDPETGIKNYIANSGKGWATTTEYVRKSLEQAATAPVPERYRLFGQALHPLEDLYAHSNFVELTLRHLGHSSVFAWVGEKSEVKVTTRSRKVDVRLPMVTGVFGFADEVVSLMEILLEGLYIPPGSPKQANTRGLLETLAPKHWTIEQILFPGSKAAEVALDGLGRMKKLMLDSVQATKDHVKRKLAAAAVTVLQKAAETEKGFLENIRDPNRANDTNPTHSMLSKDHPEHPLHELAARCAIKAVSEVGLAMRDVWQNTRPAQYVVDVALSYFVHPNDIFLEHPDLRGRQGDLVRFIDSYVKNKGALLTKLDRESSIRTFLKIAHEERHKLAQLTDDVLQGDEKLVKGMLALLPDLESGFKRGTA